MMEPNEYEDQWAEGEEKKEMDQESAALIQAAKDDEKNRVDEYAAGYKELDATK